MTWKIYFKFTSIDEHRQLEAHNIETTQHIDRRVADIWSTINAPQKMRNLGTNLRVFDANEKEIC